MTVTADIITENLYQCKLAKPKIITSSFCDLCQFTFCIQYDSRRGAASGNEQNEPDDGCVAGAGLRGRGELFNAHGSLFIAAHAALLVLLALLGGSGRAVDLPYELVRLDILLVMADGALLIVAVLVVGVLVVMVAGDAFGLGLAADSAGVFDGTGDKAGRLLSDYAVIPLVGFDVLLVVADGAFLIVIILVVSILVVVLAGDALGLSLAAGGAGVLHRTGGEAGAGVSHDTVVPCVREHPAEDGIALGAICPVTAAVVLKLRTDVFRTGDSASADRAGGADAGGVSIAAVVAGLHIAAVGAAALAGLVFRIVVLLIQGQSAYAGCLVIAGGILTA